MSEVGGVARAVIQRLAAHDLAAEEILGYTRDLASGLADHPDKAARKRLVRCASLHAEFYLRSLRPTGVTLIDIDAPLPNGESADLVYECPTQDGTRSTFLFDNLITPDEYSATPNADLRLHLDDARAAHELTGGDFGGVRFFDTWNLYRSILFEPVGTTVLGMPIHHHVIAALMNERIA